MLLWLYLFLPAVLGQAGFGRSYLRNSRLCHQWNCINNKLGLPDSLPPITQTREVLSRVLPQGAWQDGLDKVLEGCYGKRSRRYTNTCPGQALLHCVVDQMIDNCPEESQRKNDACAPVTSLAGLKNMFTQSRYDNLETNLPKERRPDWFMKNYFNQKCCDLPEIFNRTVIEECRFSSFITYYTHPLTRKESQNVQPHLLNDPSITLHSVDGNTLKIYDINQFVSTEPVDPMECCDMSDFIQPSWRSECDFKLTWGGHNRLVFDNKTVATTATPTTTPNPADLPKDLQLLPQTCEKETCLFRKLNIIQESGAVDVDAYSKMLDNFTNAHPAWTKAKARVVTKCLRRKVRDYEADCEINKILACTLDVLTENCPYNKKSDVCKHGNQKSGCQISSSKYGPKNRREICLLPELIHHEHLSECGLDSLYRAEHVVDVPKPRKQGWIASKYLCKDTTAASTCVMNKMGILNKYNFMDYFKMKDRIRQFSSDKAEWSALLDIYMSAFINIPMYTEHCSSQKKLLNVIDSMLMTCPISKRQNTPQCNRIFIEMANTMPLDNLRLSQEKLGQVLKHYHHVFMPDMPVHYRKRIHKHHKQPFYNYGLLDSKDAPEVKTINIKPTRIEKQSKPLVLLPVYLRTPPYKDGVFRNGNNPFWLHDQISNAHTSTRATPIASNVTPTVNVTPRNVQTAPTMTPLFPVYTDMFRERPFDMVRP